MLVCPRSSTQFIPNRTFYDIQVPIYSALTKVHLSKVSLYRVTEGEIQDSINMVILSYRSVKQEPYQYYADLDLVLSLAFNLRRFAKLIRNCAVGPFFLEVALKFIINIIRKTRSVFLCSVPTHLLMHLLRLAYCHQPLFSTLLDPSPLFYWIPRFYQRGSKWWWYSDV